MSLFYFWKAGKIGKLTTSSKVNFLSDAQDVLSSALQLYFSFSSVRAASRAPPTHVYSVLQKSQQELDPQA